MKGTSMLLYVNKDELNELYQAMIVYYADFKANKNIPDKDKYAKRIEKIEKLLNKITYECMYYS